MGTLDGKVALVTGASRGIGAAVAQRLASEGARVAAMARTLEPDPRYTGSLKETVESIRSAGHEAIAVRGDLSSADDRRRIVAETVEAFGPVGILVNNAAVTFIAPVEEFSEKRFRLMIEVQVWAPFELTQLVLPGMRERGAGWVLNISSRAALHPEGPPYDPMFERGFSVYGLCKAALERFTTAVASEGHRHGIRSNALAPLDNVATPGAGAHDLVSDFPIEDSSVIAEAALALVEGDITGRIAYSQTLLDELGRKAPTG
ncbi:SDR family NAD(P)-dependent oxidoreductase [Frankia sp. Cppng1_Ct_nod]|uniref:SDR family NAD(P)-dependent oxidoreductase n=1 Tax=Frankia sp. Cppng1_Ct_nod TaxID=2897162 RepID=UPI00104168AF|nr:SDR family NAD(P)-dependent oxidoreductase [Frankia sp. Cppng1_Ct_nod]